MANLFTPTKPIIPVLQRKHPLARGLKLAWLFWEGGGSKVYDMSGNGFHGDLLSFADLSAAWINTKYGIAVSLDGTNDRIRNSAWPSIGTEPRTLLFFLNNRTVSGVNVLGSIGNDIGGGSKRFGWYGNGNVLNFWNSDGGGDTNLGSIWTTGYHTLIGSKPNTAAGGVTNYDDRQDRAHNNYVGTTDDGVFIGVNDADVGNDWHPEIDIIAAMIWDRELTDSEKKMLINDPFIHFRPKKAVLGSVQAAVTAVKDLIMAGIIPFAR